MLGLGLSSGRIAAGRRSSGGYAFVNAEAAAVAARMAVPPPEDRKALIDTLVGELKAGGAWARMDALYVTAAHDAQAARLDWKGGFDATLVGAPTFVVDLGYSAGGGANGLETGFQPGVNGAIGADDCHYAVFTTVQAGGSSADFGTSTSSDYLRNGVSGNFRGAIGGVNMLGSGAGVPRHGCLNRPVPNSTKLYENGAMNLNAGENPAASTAFAPATLHLCRVNGLFGSARRHGAFHFGRGLSEPQIVAAYQALRNYLAAIGVAGV